MRSAVAILGAILIFTITACQSHPPQVTHVVICWLKTPGSETDRQRLIDESEKLKPIPGLVTLTAGRPIKSARPVVDSTYDVAFVMTFKDEAALHSYEKNPIHLRAVNDVLRPLTAKLTIYDIRNGKAGVLTQKRVGAATAPAQ
jgi:hypothetical protein